MKSKSLKTYIFNAALCLLLVGFGFGVSSTYEKYKGTGLSRIPHTGEPGNEKLNQGMQPVHLPNSGRLVSSTTGREVSTSIANPPDFHSTIGSNGSTAELKLYPTVTKGMRTPFDLWKYYGRGTSSFASPILPMRFEQWLEFNRKQKPILMNEVRNFMESRFDYSGDTIPGHWMSGGRKPIMVGPIARLPKGVDSFEAYNDLTAEEIRKRDLFPYKPLAHPLQTNAHMLFSEAWLQVHPEHRRIDVDFDMPDDYLPEFPPALFLTTHKELGDVTNGQEISINNYYEMFDGLLTPEQMEGLKELLRPSPTTWFNHTSHRLTESPSQGVSCLDCHVNGHTNAAIELAPDSRPNMARLRVDTPTLRGNYNLLQLSSKRTIRSLTIFLKSKNTLTVIPACSRRLGLVQ